MPSYTFTECLDRFLQDSRYHKPATTDRNRCCARHLRRYFSGLYVSGDFRLIDGATVTRYREERKQFGAAPGCVKRELAVGSAAVEYCRTQLDWDVQNPFKGRLISKADARTIKPRKRVLSPAEEAAILLASPPLLRDIVSLALFTGFRQGEILGLEWDRVVGDVVMFTPDSQKSGKHGCRALSASAVAIINRQERAGPLVFHYQGQRIRKETLIRWWRKACEKAKVEDAIFHDTRKTAGQRMLEAGASMEAVQAQLGHDDVRTTQAWYVSPSIDLARDAVQRIAVRG